MRTLDLKKQNTKIPAHMDTMYFWTIQKHVT